MGDQGLVADFLEQAVQGYEAFLGKLEMTVAEADGTWSRVQAGTGLLRLCALPRLLHFFRALPPAATTAFAERADAASLQAYVDSFKHGALPHGGGGVGSARPASFPAIRAGWRRE